MPDAVFDQSCDIGVSSTEPGRALVPLTVRERPVEGPAPAFRPDARFVTQLIANATYLPQTRALRRAEPADAMAAYAGTFTLPVAANDQRTRRVA